MGFPRRRLTAAEISAVAVATVARGEGRTRAETATLITRDLTEALRRQRSPIR